MILVPFIAFYYSRGGLFISRRVLIFSALFGISFGFVEATVVVYLRAAVGLLPGYGGILSDVQNLSSGIYQQSQILVELPKSLLITELFREVATMVMLFSVAVLTVKTHKERWAIFLWTFAAWDLFYYFGLWAIVRWPSSLLTPDVLFLIPVPWLSQVWFPMLVDSLTMIAVIAMVRQPRDLL